MIGLSRCALALPFALALWAEGGGARTTYTIAGQVTLSGGGLSGVAVAVTGTQTCSVSTNSSGNYSCPGLAAGGNYTVTPSLSGYTFAPTALTYNNLSADQAAASFTACQPNAPCYSAGGIVNTANGSGAVAPFTYISISGTNLSAHGDLAPYLAIRGVRVLANQQPAFVSYVSPGLVIVLLPSNITGSQVTLQLTRDSTAGPAVTLEIHDCAPTLFQLDQATAVAAHFPDWTVVTPDSPAHAGKRVVLYATGLGPFLIDQVPAPEHDPILRRREFEVFLDGQLVADNLVDAGGSGLLGVYEIDLDLPANVGKDPEIRIKLGDQVSPPGVRLPVK
jgi:uncharacterized protein (TIGR03437 family)